MFENTEFRTIEKVWGREVILVDETDYALKRLEMRGGFQMSVHYHPEKKETFIFEKGCAVMLIAHPGDKDLESSLRIYTASPNDEFLICPNAPHSVIAIGDVSILEVADCGNAACSVRIKNSRRAGRVVGDLTAKRMEDLYD